MLFLCSDSISLLIPNLYRVDMREDPPTLEHVTGSREIASVSTAMESLYKVVRSANKAFYDGDLETAYLVLVDALRLFMRLENKKAIGIASNNLGNTMLAMYLAMKELHLEEFCGLTSKEIIGKGTGHFHDAIQLGEKAYDEFYDSEGWTPNCLDFMQHLSNRYFNRAMFLLAVKDDHEKPEELEQLGLRDLTISRDMDLEIVAYGEDIGFNRESRAAKLFNVCLVRARGHNMLLERGDLNGLMAEKGYPDDWELDEQLNHHYKMLLTEMKLTSSELFVDVSVVGRMQEIEAELIKYKMLTGDLEPAAQISIRMLLEDAFHFADAQAVAVEALSAYVNTMDTDDVSRSKMTFALRTYQSGLNHDLDASMSTLDEMSKQSSTKGLNDDLLAVSQRSLVGRSELNKSRRSSMAHWVTNQHSGRFVTMEDF
jgi:hypothetical protein